MNQAHINCSCSREKTIPVKELAYIKGQKEKVGSKGPHQMGGPDLPEHKRQVKKLERQDGERGRGKEKEEPQENPRSQFSAFVQLWAGLQPILCGNNR